ncbi:hypothetical protein [Fodinibius sp. Rm-B-1B1-1]|uniref:hypothetical protein n=1 Tax=Fodinibius alkaliphilus TaxID=3140241 RepID=UPI003159C579
MMDDLQYKEHKLAQKAQRIVDLKHELQQFKEKKENHLAQKPTCDENSLSYRQSISFGEKVDEFEEQLQQINVQIMRLERQLSALEHQAGKLIPVTGIKIRVHAYSDEGNPTRTFCIEQKQNGSQSDINSITIEQFQEI